MVAGRNNEPLTTPPAPGASRGLSWLVAGLAAAVFCSSLALGPAAELLLRLEQPVRPGVIKPEYYPERLGDLRPFQDVLDRTDPGNPFRARTNNQGLRGERHTDRHPAPGVMRVLCLGDSFTFGAGVADDKAFPAQLEVLLQKSWPDERFEVLNAGTPFYGLEDSLEYFMEKGRLLGAQVVVCQFYDDDLIAMTKPPFRTYGLKRREVFHRVESLLRQDDAARLLLRLTGEHLPRILMRWTRLDNPPTDTVVPPGVRVGPGQAALLDSTAFRLDPANTQALRPVWSHARRLLEELDRQVRASGGRLVLLLAPNRLQMDQALDAARGQLAGFALERGITVVDPAPVFRRVFMQHGQQVYLDGNSHFNERGNTLAAVELAEVMRLAAGPEGARLETVPGARLPGLGQAVTVRFDPREKRFVSDSPLVTVEQSPSENLSWREDPDHGLRFVSAGERGVVGVFGFVARSSRPMASMRLLAYPREGSAKGAGGVDLRVGFGEGRQEEIFSAVRNPRAWNSVDAPFLDERTLPDRTFRVEASVTLAGEGELVFNLAEPSGRAERRLEWTFFLQDP